MSGVRIHNVAQGSDEWIAARCGLLTASEIKLIVTPANLKPASNDKERAHLYDLLAQRITGHVEPSYISDAMLSGYDGELVARALYSEHFAPVREVGFLSNDKWGFTLGCSPDGLVGEDGMIEIKSPRQKAHVQNLIEHFARGAMPPEHALQVQTALLVSERAWCDFISYCPGLPMGVTRAAPDAEMQRAIIAAAQAFESKLAEKLAAYRSALAPGSRWVATERTILGELAA